MAASRGGAIGQHPLLHAAVHVRMLVAGCLLSWHLAIADPMPRRAGVPARLLAW